MRKVLVASALTLLFAIMAGPALAQPPPHNHLLTVPGTGTAVEVGPPRCELGETLQTAFLEFHSDVHLGEPAGTGDLTITPSFCP
jgi:hypothetical protein